MTIIFRLHECNFNSISCPMKRKHLYIGWPCNSQVRCKSLFVQNKIKKKKKHKSEQMSGHAMLTCCSILCISLNLWPSNLKKKKLTSHMEKTLKGLLLHWFLMLSGLDGFVLVVVDYLQQFTLL